MNKIKFILTILAISASSIFGEVRFNLVFTDKQGAGFNSPKHSWMKQEAEKAANLVGKVIDQNACINIRVNDTKKTPYAWAPAEHYKMISEANATKVVLNAQHKILSEKTTSDSEWDGHIEFNLEQFSREHSDEFRRTFVHELTHTLGFLNFQNPRESRLSYYNDYDKLFYDANGNPFIINQGGLVKNPKFNSFAELYACGDCIRKHNKGKCVKIYNPKIYECGSSFAHVDRDAHPRSIMADRKSHDEYCIWNNYELGIMEELGYKINWENYYKIIRELYPATILLNVDGSVLKETNTSFQVITNQDFPKECFTCDEVNDPDKKFSVKINKESRLVLLDKKTNAPLFTFEPKEKSKKLKIQLANKSYEVSCNKIGNQKEMTIDIQVTRS